MTPVDQTKFGKPHGNCLAAATASVTDIPLEDFPDLSEENGWYRRYEVFLNHRGYELLYLDNTCHPYRPPCYAIGAGMSPRGLMHSCVFLDGKLVHDPHPSRDGIAYVSDWCILCLRGAADCSLTKP